MLEKIVRRKRSDRRPQYGNRHSGIDLSGAQNGKLAEYRKLVHHCPNKQADPPGRYRSDDRRPKYYGESFRSELEVSIEVRTDADVNAVVNNAEGDCEQD